MIEWRDLFSLSSSLRKKKLSKKKIYSADFRFLSYSLYPLEESRETQENCAIKCSSNNKCITKDEICDLEPNCPDGEDEKQDCGKRNCILPKFY